MSELFLDNSFIFLTTPTFLHERFLNTNEKKKKIVLNQFQKVRQVLKVPFYGWSIVETHYHNLFYLEEAEILSKLIQTINGSSSYLLNKLDNKSRNVWGDRWLKIIHSKESFYLVLGYIIGNALKHGIVNNFRELKAYPFSSFRETARVYGEEFAQELVLKAIKFD